LSRNELGLTYEPFGPFRFTLPAQNHEPTPNTTRGRLMTLSEQRLSE